MAPARQVQQQRLPFTLRLPAEAGHCLVSLSLVFSSYLAVPVIEKLGGPSFVAAWDLNMLTEVTRQVASYTFDKIGHCAFASS